MQTHLNRNEKEVIDMVDMKRKIDSNDPSSKQIKTQLRTSVIQAGDALEEVKLRPEVKLVSPQRIYATNLRKQTATIAQALSLDSQQLKNVCNHLGHTQKVHDAFYRQTSGLVERIDIAKLMLMQEHNLVGKYANKKLSEIQFEELEESIHESKGGDTDATASDSHLDDWELSGMVDSFSEQPQKKKSQKVRVKWTEVEENEIKKYFSSYFDGTIKKTCPSQQHCLLAVKKSAENQGELHRRKWDTLKKKVSNMLLKNAKYSTG
ncbi:uncharacterized protein LOC132563439 [Ylistrum balloti]|uniref:uncharacterized protein LOC132563439 n=1 Tax=Ylistrum balloti TaxID=509963 RepID=UPI002905D027|nr:uncharacterized protein LOC132563439 [Ylistrum balloti]